MSILVTGASGFIGTHLCRELLRQGQPVVALCYPEITSDITALSSHREFRIHKGDIRDTDMMRNLIRSHRVKSVFHLAAQLPGENDIDDPFPGFDTNARGTLSVLNAAYHGRVRIFVYASSMSVYSEPPQYLPVDENHPTRPGTVYGMAKVTGELGCNLYSGAMNITVLRYAGAYGRGERESNAIPTFIHQALNNKPITLYGDGTQSSDFVYIDDVVPGTILAWEKNKPGVYNIGSGEETSVRELAKRIVVLTNSRSEIVLTEQRTERPFRFFLDIAKAQKTLGYSPRSLDEGLKIYLKEFKS